MALRALSNRRAPGFVATVTNIQSLTDTDAKEVCIEITESAFVHDAGRALAVLSELKDLGIRLALDDFGTGYSSLSCLMESPVDIVKIDQSFVAKLTENKASHAIVTKTIELAHLLDLTSFARASRRPNKTAKSRRSRAISRRAFTYRDQRQQKCSMR